MEFCSVLTILFIGLKLCGVVAWPWWLVLSPLFAAAVLAVLMAVTLFVFCGRR